MTKESMDLGFFDASLTQDQQQMTPKKSVPKVTPKSKKLREHRSSLSNDVTPISLEANVNAMEVSLPTQVPNIQALASNSWKLNKKETIIEHVYEQFLKSGIAENVSILEELRYTEEVILFNIYIKLD